jgi:hypothetical protein
MPDADAASTDRRAEEDVARAGPAGVAAARAPCATPLKAARARLSRIPGKPALLGTIVRVLPPARGTGRRLRRPPPRPMRRPRGACMHTTHTSATAHTALNPAQLS